MGLLLLLYYADSDSESTYVYTWPNEAPMSTRCLNKEYKQITLSHAVLSVFEYSYDWRFTGVYLLRMQVKYQIQVTNSQN